VLMERNWLAVLSMCDGCTHCGDGGESWALSTKCMTEVFLACEQNKIKSFAGRRLMKISHPKMFDSPLSLHILVYYSVFTEV